MPSLKDLRNRIRSVKSTQKITSAMKMVSAAKLRRAQESAESARAYAERMERMLASVAKSMAGVAGAPPLLAGTGRDETHLLVVFTADRGLCGSYNSAIVRRVRALAAELQRQGKTVKLFCVGRKGRDLLRRGFERSIVESVTNVGRKGVAYGEAVEVAEKLLALFRDGTFDAATLVFNRFKSALTQIVTVRRVVPFQPPEKEAPPEAGGESVPAVHVFEPEEAELLAELLPAFIRNQIYQALLESAASEHGARMTAMDNATRNAGEMIGGLTLRYNRTRQASITKELIEIISGAEAL
jgi:F-type H+-transporting ATPase subunit gamma